MNSALTQISRGNKVSKPTREILRLYTLRNYTVLHFGAGKAQADTYAIQDDGATFVAEYDPNSPIFTWRNPAWINRTYDAVVCNYVLNVLTPRDRKLVLDQLSAVIPNGRGYISVRSVDDKSIKGRPMFDGVVTSRDTFQKAYTKDSLVNELHLFFDTATVIYNNGGTLIAKVGNFAS